MSLYKKSIWNQVASKNIDFFIPTGHRVTREHQGLPTDWNVVEKWARGKFNFGVPLTDNSINKFSGLNFSKPADSTFWDNFPSRQLPSKPSTRGDIPQLRRAIHAAKKNWTIHEKKSAEKTLENLTLGAPSHQKSPLPGCTRSPPPLLETSCRSCSSAAATTRSL